MTKRLLPNLSVLALAVSAIVVLAACGPKVDEAAKKDGEGHSAEVSHISAKDGDAARGEKLAKEKIAGRQSCIECHGDKGNAPSADMAAPVLAGQYQDYLFHTLQAYREGARDNALMTSHAKALHEAGKFDDQSLADLSAYFAAQSSDLGDLHGTN
jgi:cytochrome c553